MSVISKSEDIKNKNFFIFYEIYPFIKSKLLLKNPEFSKISRFESLDFLLNFSGSYSVYILYYIIELGFFQSHLKAIKKAPHCFGAVPIIIKRSQEKKKDLFRYFSIFWVCYVLPRFRVLQVP